jgi:hypothetical protein
LSKFLLWTSFRQVCLVIKENREFLASRENLERMAMMARKVTLASQVLKESWVHQAFKALLVKSDLKAKLEFKATRVCVVPRVTKARMDSEGLLE